MARAAVVPCGVRLLWGCGNWAASPQPALPPLLPPMLPPPPHCGRPWFWKGNSHHRSIWDLERDGDAALSEGIDLRSFFRTSPTCLLLNVRVMGSASDKTAYYS